MIETRLIFESELKKFESQLSEALNTGWELIGFSMSPKSAVNIAGLSSQFVPYYCAILKRDSSKA